MNLQDMPRTTYAENVAWYNAWIEHQRTEYGYCYALEKSNLTQAQYCAQEARRAMVTFTYNSMVASMQAYAVAVAQRNSDEPRKRIITWITTILDHGMGDYYASVVTTHECLEGEAIDEHEAAQDAVACLTDSGDFEEPAAYDAAIQFAVEVISAVTKQRYGTHEERFARKEAQRIALYGQD